MTKSTIRTRHDRRTAKAEAATPAPAPAGSTGGDYATIRHDSIRPDPANPRKLFDDDGLAELAASIAADGLLEPLIVRDIGPDADGFGVYMLIAGERRWRAIGQAVFAGAWPLDRPVPCMIRDVSEADARRLALVENLQRRDLNPIEEARALQALVELTGVSAAQVGRDLGFTERWAQQRLSLLKLPEALQGRLDAGDLKVEDARTAAAMWDKLPPIKRKELEKGVRTVGDVKRWLDNLPKPLSEAAQLAICEVLAKTETAGFKAEEYSSRMGVKIVAETIAPEGEHGHPVHRVNDPVFDELRGRYLIESADAVEVEDVATGEHYTMTTHQTDWTLRDVLPAALKAESRDRLIVELRVKLHGLQVDNDLTKSGRYATPWLNPEPVAITAELQAQIDANRAVREQREAARNAERQAHDQASAAAHQARVDRIKRLEIADAAGEVAGNAGALAIEIGRPLPWFLDELTNIILDANGAAVTDRPWNGSIDLTANLRLVVALANAAGGVTTPTKHPTVKDPEAPSREEFVEAVAAFLLDDCDEEGEPILSDEAAQVQADAGITAYLTAEGIEYGHADHDWGETGALAIAKGIREDGLGKQVDLESAIEAADAENEEITDPKLLALAGVKATA